MIRRAFRLNYLFGSAKHNSHEVGTAHHSSGHDHHDHLPHYDPDPHGLSKQQLLITGTGPVSNVAKKWLRFIGWEPDTPRSRTESPHFNQYLNLPITQEKPNSLYRYMLHLPLFVTSSEQSMSKSDVKQLNSDYIEPADINVPGSVFVYESFLQGNALKRFRSLEPLILSVGLILGNYPIVNAVAIGAGFFVFHARIYIPSKVLVRRLDILPDTQQLRVERVGWFGRERIQNMKIEDIEYVQQTDPVFNSVTFWNHNRTYADRYLVFRNKKTQGLLVFDRDGAWSEEGLKHHLIY